MGDKCKIDICQNNANADDACLQDAGLNVCGGFVPCGRMANNPNTPWDDTATCDFCHIAVLLNLFMDFLVSMALIISILAIVFTGFLFITSGGNPENRNKAKSYFKGIMIGFFVIFLAWLLIDFLFIVWGFLDPMGGQWNVVCE